VEQHIHQRCWQACFAQALPGGTSQHSRTVRFIYHPLQVLWLKQLELLLAQFILELQTQLLHWVCHA
jgi:hypothetical protein